MYRIPSAKENIIMAMPQKIPIYTFSATLGHNGISIIIFFKAPALECIVSGTWSSDIFFGTTSNNFPLKWFSHLLIFLFSGFPFFWFSPYWFTPLLVMPYSDFPVSFLFSSTDFSISCFFPLTVFFVYWFSPTLAFLFNNLLFARFPLYWLSPRLVFSFIVCPLYLVTCLTGFLLFWLSCLMVSPL